MSRLFDNAASQKLLYTSPVLTAAPMTMSCWFYTDETTNQTLLALGNSTNTTDAFRLMLRAPADPSQGVMAATNAPASGGEVTTTTTYSTNTWHHGAAVFASSSSRSAYLDGGGKATDTASGTPTVDQTSIGVWDRLVPVGYMSGRIAEVAVWNVALSDEEIVSLAKGFSPVLIRPSALVAYWPLFGNDSPELDRWKSRFDMTVTGATKDVHSRMYYPINPV